MIETLTYSEMLFHNSHPEYLKLYTDLLGNKLNSNMSVVTALDKDTLVVGTIILKDLEVEKNLILADVPFVETQFKKLIQSTGNNVLIIK